MWFTFPSGAESITVEQQEFRALFTDSKGFNYFQAPDNFAGRILDIPGFEVRNPPKEENPPEDRSFTRASPGDENIRALTGRISSLELELSAARANLATAVMERDQLKLENFELRSKISELEDPGESEEEAAQDDLKNLSPIVIPKRK